jgi:hypothetical protein
MIAKKEIPKCKNCKELDAYKIGKCTFYDCYNPDIHTRGKKIYAKDIKTSPAWCPLREKN